MAVHTFPVSAANNMWWKEIGIDGFVVVGNISGNAQNGFVRFPNVTIPQGSVVTSASLRLFKQSSAVSGSVLYSIFGIDEDNTATFGSDPSGRPKTSANQTGSTSANLIDQYVGFDVTDEVNEILARGGWASGNAMGFHVQDNGTTTTDARITDIYDGVPSTDAELVITLNEPSASPSASRSASRSLSPSPSLSPSGSASPSGSISPSPLPDPLKGILAIAKPGINAITNSDPEKFIFHSRYGTLKYFSKQMKTVQFDANLGLIAGSETIDHNLDYYPYVEVFVLNEASGNYEYCPFAGSGATVEYSASYKVTPTQIILYAQINGVSVETWTFEFLVFIFKNNLNLS